jgi:hypothetical protein
MKRVVMILVIFASLVLISQAMAQTYVDGYYRSNGTYVAPHYRSSPNSTTQDNWSTKGNTNPITGQPGYRSPDYNSGYGGSSSSYGSGYQNPYGKKRY